MKHVLLIGLMVLNLGIVVAQSPKIQRIKAPVAQPVTSLTTPNRADRHRVFITARYQADSVVLRWAPETATDWRAAIKHGYVIEKAVVENGIPRYAILSSTKALDQAALLAIYQSEKSRSAALSLATLYNETAVKPETLNLEQMQTKAQAFQLIFGYNLLSSDLDPQVANWSGLRLVDRAIQKGKVYGYRVYFQKPVSGLSDTAYVLVDTRYPDTLPIPPSVRAIASNTSVKLEWDYAPEQFSAWWIEKSKPGQEEFFPLHQYPYTYSEDRVSGPLLRSSFADTGLSAYEPWEYRLIGITAFGERIEGKQRLIAQAKDVTPPAVPDWEEVKPLGNKTKLDWSYAGITKDLGGFIIMKSEQAAAGFIPVSPPLAASTRTWTDTITPPTTGVYYQVMAFDTAGNSINSASKLVFGKDTIAPLVPTWIEGIADTNGIVRLKWKASLDADLQGYRLYKAYAADHAFALVTPRTITDTFYQDTLMRRSLTTKVFYRLSAEDLSDNVSNLGALLLVKRPDLVAPEPPVVLSAKTEKELILLKILPSQSEDVQRHKLERRVNNASSWEVIDLYNPINGEEITVIDSNFTSNAFITYRLLAIDSSGNQSHYSRLVGIKAPMRKKDYFSNLRVNWLSDVKKVVVEWRCERNETDGFVSLIRQIGEQSPRTIQSFKEEISRFEDSGLVSGQKVQYWLRYAGANSEYFTAPIEMVIP